MRNYSQEVRRITVGDRVIDYTLVRKNVKNINLRVKDEKTVVVSANRFMSGNVIDSFVESKSDFLIKAFERAEMRKEVSDDVKSRAPLRSYDDLLKICREEMPFFRELGAKTPVIHFRSMKTRWGSCRKATSSISLNTMLTYVPLECARYVIVHEMAHLIQANHSKAFWNLVERKMPGYKKAKEELKKYTLL